MPAITPSIPSSRSSSPTPASNHDDAETSNDEIQNGPTAATQAHIAHVDSLVEEDQNLFHFDEYPDRSLFEESENFPSSLIAERYSQYTLGRLNQLNERAQKDALEKSQASQKIIEYFIQNDIELLPKEKTLLALVEGKISKNIFCAWAKTSSEPEYEEEDTAEQLAQDLTTFLFNAVQEETPGPLTALLREGKLSATQWESWIDHIRQTDEYSPYEPFPFDNKIEDFLYGAIHLEDNVPTYEGPTENAYCILSALQQDRLDAKQLDIWMRNPRYDLDIVADLAERISPQLNAEQITQLEELVFEEAKLTTAFELKNLKQKTRISDAARSKEIARHTIRLDALASNREIDDASPTSDRFLTATIDHWIKIYEALPDKTFSSRQLLTPEEINFVDHLRQGTWQQRISRLALLNLIKNGIPFDQAKHIIQTENHITQIPKKPTQYVRSLATLTYPGVRIKDLERFDFDDPIDFLLCITLENARDDNLLRAKLAQEKIGLEPLKQIFDELVNRIGTANKQIFDHHGIGHFTFKFSKIEQLKIYSYATNILRNMGAVLSLEHIDDILKNDDVLEAFSKISNDKKAIDALIALNEKMDFAIYAWLDNDNVKRFPSLPFAMQTAFELGIDLNESLKPESNTLANLCLLFGTDIGEYGAAIKHAIAQDLFTAADLKKVFLIRDGYLYDEKNAKQFCSHVLPRILKKEITFEDFLASLNQLHHSFKNTYLLRREQNIFIQQLCQGATHEELQAFLSSSDKQKLLCNPKIAPRLEDGTITRKQLLDWMNGSPSISAQRIQNFRKAFVLLATKKSRLKINLETLERWMHDPSIQPKAADSFTYHWDNPLFEPVFAKQLKKENGEVEPLSAEELIAAEHHYETQLEQLNARNRAKALDLYIQNQYV